MLTLSSILRKVGFLSLLGAFLHAQTPHPKIKKLLDQAVAKKYEIDKSGNFKLIIRRESERTQMVIVFSNTHEFRGEEIVEVLSVGQAVPAGESVDGERFLRNSNTRKIGAWQLMEDEESQKVYVVFVAKLPLSGLKPDFLRDVCIGVATTADEMEAELTGRDDF